MTVEKLMKRRQELQQKKYKLYKECGEIEQSILLKRMAVETYYKNAIYKLIVEAEKDGVEIVVPFKNDYYRIKPADILAGELRKEPGYAEIH